MENEKIVAQKERELELLRANAAKESEEQHVSTKTTYILQFLIIVDKMEIDWTLNFPSNGSSIFMQEKLLVEAEEQIDRLEKEVKHLKTMQVKLAAFTLSKWQVLLWWLCTFSWGDIEGTL